MKNDEANETTQESVPKAVASTSESRTTKNTKMLLQRRATNRKKAKNSSNKEEEKRNEVNRNTSQERQSDHIPEFTEQEQHTAMDGLKKGKAADTRGIEAEDLKACDETVGMMRGNFNEITKQGSMASKLVESSDTKSSTRKVMEQDQNLSCNWHVVNVFIVFSTLPCNRQSPDQGGFQTKLPDDGPSYDVQSAGLKEQCVSQ